VGRKDACSAAKIYELARRGGFSVKCRHYSLSVERVEDANDDYLWVHDYRPESTKQSQGATAVVLSRLAEPDWRVAETGSL